MTNAFSSFLNKQVLREVYPARSVGAQDDNWSTAR